jgi:hypothetical protein
MADYFTFDSTLNNSQIQNEDLPANRNMDMVTTIDSNIPNNYGALSPDSIIASSAAVEIPTTAEGYTFNKDGIIDVT